MRRLSAQNPIKGNIVAVQKGVTTAYVRSHVSGDVTITASITDESVDDLALTAGDDAWAVIKATDMMIGKMKYLSLWGAATAIAILTAGIAHADNKPVTIDGAVKQVQHVTGDELRRLPAVERQVTFETDHGPQTATYTGVLLWTLIERAKVDDAAKWGELRHVLAVTAQDGYLVMVSIGEIDPNFGNAPVMLAYAQNGKPLPTLRLVFPGDKHGARNVRDVMRVEVR